MSEKDLKSKIFEWLESQGYPLEMLVAAKLQENHFSVIQSDYYNDSENADVSREIDILAYKQAEIKGILFRLTLVIECKLSSKKPWILFSSQGARIAKPAQVAQRVASTLGSIFLMKLAQDKEIQCLPFFSIPDRCGYSVTQAFTSGKDIPFEAITTVSKCALSKVSAANTAFKVQGPFAEIIFPVVIVDGKFFDCYLNTKNEAEISEINCGYLVWRNQIAREPHTLLRISTIDDLDNLIANANETIENLFSKEDVLWESFIEYQKILKEI